MPGEEAELFDLLAALQAAKVRFVLVGGAAAVVHGAPVTTHDIDIVPDRESPNLDRLYDLLTDLDARVRDLTERRLVVKREHLEGPGQLQIQTRLGPIDVLRTLHDGRGYEELSGHVVTLDDGSGPLQVIDLETLIDIKADAGRPKDKMVLPILVRLLEETRKR